MPGLREEARKLARRNIDALLDGGFDAIITNAAGCGSTLRNTASCWKTIRLTRRRRAGSRRCVNDVTEFLASIELNSDDGRGATPRCTYQDSCHLAHGQRIRTAPRKLLAAVPA